MSGSFNFLSPTGFQFGIAEAPDLSFYVQGVTLPGITLGSAARPTPFVPQHIPGNISYEQFTVSFKITESMDEYFELLKWMHNLGLPTGMENFKYRKSDCSVLLLNSSKNPTIEAKFTDCFPVSLSPIVMDLTSTDIQYVSATATFEFLTFSYEKI